MICHGGHFGMCEVLAIFPRPRTPLMHVATLALPTPKTDTKIIMYIQIKRKDLQAILNKILNLLSHIYKMHVVKKKNNNRALIYE